MDFEISWFSHLSLNVKLSNKSNGNHNYHFRIRISTVFQSWAPPMHMNFASKSWKEIIENAPATKTYISRIIAKTKEIAICWPPIINRMTVWFFVFNENNVAFKYLWKNIWYLRVDPKQSFHTVSVSICWNRTCFVAVFVGALVNRCFARSTCWQWVSRQV